MNSTDSSIGLSIDYEKVTNLPYFFRTLVAVWLLASAPQADSEEFTDVAIRAQLTPINTALISSSLTARIASFSVRVGDRVNVGDTLVIFDCRRQQADANIAQTRLISSTSQVTINERLAKLDNISLLELEMSRAQVKIHEAEFNRAKAITSECILKAPFPGTVTEKHAHAFEHVNEGDPLFHLVDLENLETEMIIPSTELKEFVHGFRFSIAISETGETVNAIVDRSAGVVDPISESIKIIGRIERASKTLLPGMSGEIVSPESRVSQQAPNGSR